jgi:hypothetical protein
MDVNPFLLARTESSEEIFLPRLYGRVERFEIDQQWRFLFDAVGADFFDNEDPPKSLDHPWFDLPPLRALEMNTPANDFELLQAIWDNDDPIWVEDRESPWLEIALASTYVKNSRSAKLYDSLLGVGEEVFVTKIAPANEAVAKKLEETFSLDSVQDISDREISALTGVGSPDYVTVYDVGQGNCNAIWSSDGRPDCVAQLYYDFGGAILQNRSTFPAALQRWCFTADPPVILSHWDWDHWSSEARDPRVRNMTWLAPRQTIGPTHAAFAASLSNLRMWPTGMASYTNGALTIEQCIGSGRNHSGLALIIDHNHQRMLLPGDARYSAIPSAASPAIFTSVCVPHHGADMKSKYVPASASLAYSRAAYSFGAGNTFSHPRTITKNQHHNAGWTHVPPGTPPPLMLTTNVRPTRCGHISLHWASQSSPPVLPCGRTNCDLEIEQV